MLDFTSQERKVIAGIVLHNDIDTRIVEIVRERVQIIESYDSIYIHLDDHADTPIRLSSEQEEYS